MRFQLGFRARLAATIAGVFVLGSAAVIGVQLLLLSHLFGDTMSAQHLRVTQEADDVTRFEIGAGADGAVHLEHWEGYLPIDGPMILVTPELGPSIADLESAELRQVFGQMQDQANAEVLHRLVLWSGVVLAAAAALAVIAAGWLSKRSLGRIAEVTAATQAIGASDLHQLLTNSLVGEEFYLDIFQGWIDRFNAETTAILRSHPYLFKNENALINKVLVNHSLQS